MFLLDLDEIDTLKDRLRYFGTSRLSWARFKRADYLPPNKCELKAAVLNKVSELAGNPLSGRILFLGNLRYLGVYFSPLNLYYLQQGDTFTHMLAEVSNTPWNERHYYLLDIQNPQPHAKAFHVSPFNPLQQHYHWKIEPPGEKLLLHIESHEEVRIFDATLSLKRHELNQSNLNRVLRATPVQTLNIVTAIYWQALKLLIKGVPLHQHPNKDLACQKNN